MGEQPGERGGRQRGQVVTGTVTEIASFGATFVDIGGVTAMINVPELSSWPIKHGPAA